MATISLLSGNYGRKNGEDIGSGYHKPTSHFSNEFLPGQKLLRSPTIGFRWMDIKQGNVKKVCVFARIGKAKQHDYPWPDDVDPTSKNPLAYLSYFKPLREKHKPATLAFEKPLIDLEQKIIEVLKDLFARLTPIQRLSIARHPNRPTVLNHILNITDKWVELHGDRAGYDDPAIMTGIGSIEGRSYVFIGHQKGRNTKENIMRNFGMPTPHGNHLVVHMLTPYGHP